MCTEKTVLVCDTMQICNQVFKGLFFILKVTIFPSVTLQISDTFFQKTVVTPNALRGIWGSSPRKILTKGNTKDGNLCKFTFGHNYLKILQNVDLKLYPPSPYCEMDRSLVKTLHESICLQDL